MSLLLLDDVTVLVREGRDEIRALDRVTMDLEVGELVAVQGQRRSGRTTLLRVAAGAVLPMAGRVMFAGSDLAERRALGSDIGWAHPHLDATHGRTVLDQVAFPLLPRMSTRRARQAAHNALDRAGVGDLANMRPADCRHRERLLAGIARAIVTSPRLLILDEPMTGLDTPSARRIITLLRSIAGQGTAILLTAEEIISGAPRMLMIDRGDVRGRTMQQSAQVIELRGGA